MATACITTMHDQICQVSCKHRSSLGTWLAFAMVSFSCLGLSVSVLLYSLFVTYTGLSNASSKSLGLLEVQQMVCFFLWWAHFRILNQVHQKKAVDNISDILEKIEAMQRRLVFKYSYHSFGGLIAQYVIH